MGNKKNKGKRKGKRKRKVQEVEVEEKASGASDEESKRRKVSVEEKEVIAADASSGSDSGEPSCAKHITKSRAKSEYGLRESDLEDMDVEYARNPHYRSAAPMQLYLLSEVKQKSAEKKDALVEKERAKSEAAFAARMAKLEKASIDPLDVSPKEMAVFVFADFNDASVVKPKHGINVVKRRYKAYMLLKRMPPLFHGRTDICMLFQGMKLQKRDNPFEKLSQIVINSVRTSRLLACVLSLGPIQVRLGGYLLPQDIRGIKTAVEEFPHISRAIARAEDHMKKEVAKKIEVFEKYIKDAEFSISKDSITKTVGRMKSFPYHPIFGVDGMMVQVEQMSAESSGQRRKRLKDALAVYRLKIRSDSNFCDAFIQKTTLASCDEVAATMYLTDWLFSFCHQAWSNYSWTFEDDMTRHVMQKRLSWFDAVKKVTENGTNYNRCRKIENRAYYNSHYYNDYY